VKLRAVKRLVRMDNMDQNVVHLPVLDVMKDDTEQLAYVWGPIVGKAVFPEERRRGAREERGDEGGEGGGEDESEH